MLAFCTAVAVAAGCSENKTDYSTEVSFRDGGGTYVVTAIGGERNVAFYSQCGHWEIMMPEEAAEWLSVWPRFGDDNGRTTLSVKEQKSAYDRHATLRIVTERGVVGQIEVSQTGAAPYINFDLQSNHIRADYQGTPITVNVTSNLEWTVELLPTIAGQSVDWVSLGAITPSSQEFLFEDNTGLPRRECTARFKMLRGDYYIDLPVTQRAGNNIYENAEHITVAELLSKVELGSTGSYEIEGNYALDVWVTSDFAHKNMPDSVMYVQDRSGRGLKLALKDKADFLTPPAERAGWYDCGSNLALHVCGLEFRCDGEGNLAIVDFPTTVVMAHTAETADDLAVVQANFSTLATYANTLVEIDPVEFVFTYGCYTNFWETAAQSISAVEELWKSSVTMPYKRHYLDFHSYPQFLRDAKGQVIKLWFSCYFTQGVSKNIPQGKGKLRGVVSTYRGETILQLRNSDDEQVATSGDRISHTLVKGGPWRDVNKTVAAFEVGNSGDDATSLIFSLKNNVWNNNDIGPASSINGTSVADGMYWLSAGIRYDYATKYSSTDENRYLSVNGKNWWQGSGSILSNAKDAGEGFVLRTNALRAASGDLWLNLSVSSSQAGPGLLKIQWAETDKDDLTGVTFADIATIDVPVIDYTPFLMPYSIKMPDALKGKEHVVILIRCADNKVCGKRSGDVLASGTCRLGNLEIVQVN